MQFGRSFLGIEIGGTKLQLALGDETGFIYKILRYSVNASEGATGILREIEEGLNELGGIAEISAIGVGFGGPVDWKNGTIRVSHQVSGWSGFNLAQWLHEKTARPVAIDNDANTAALAEALQGSGKDYNRVFYMTIGSGIGGGLVINQQIYHGRLPGEVEVGHLRLNKNGETLEQKCSGWVVNKKVKSIVEAEPNSLLAGLAREEQNEPDAKLLRRALTHGDITAQKIVTETADDLGFALSHVVHLFHPDIIIIGGGLSLLGEPLRHAVAESLKAYVMTAFLPASPVVIASLGEDVVPIGAIELARKAVGL